MCVSLCVLLCVSLCVCVLFAVCVLLCVAVYILLCEQACGEEDDEARANPLLLNVFAVLALGTRLCSKLSPHHRVLTTTHHDARTHASHAPHAHDTTTTTRTTRTT